MGGDSNTEGRTFFFLSFLKDNSFKYFEYFSMFSNSVVFLDVFMHVYLFVITLSSDCCLTLCFYLAICNSCLSFYDVLNYKFNSSSL